MKAFVPFEEGQRLWQSRYGDRTSVRILPATAQPLAEARKQFEIGLATKLDPTAKKPYIFHLARLTVVRKADSEIDELGQEETEELVQPLPDGKSSRCKSLQ